MQTCPSDITVVRPASATPSSPMSTFCQLLYLIPAALVSNKQTLYHISAAQISLDTISNDHLAFMKMTGDGGPPESSSYVGSVAEEKRGITVENRRSGKGSQWRWRGECDDVTKCRGTAYRYAMGGNLATIYDQPRHWHLVSVKRS